MHHIYDFLSHFYRAPNWACCYLFAELEIRKYCAVFIRHNRSIVETKHLLIHKSQNLSKKIK